MVLTGGSALPLDNHQPGAVLPMSVVPDLAGQQDAVSRYFALRLDAALPRFDCAAGATKNCRYSIAGMDCLWGTSVWVQCSLERLRHHQENLSGTTRRRLHEFSTSPFPSCARLHVPGLAGCEGSANQKSCGGKSNGEKQRWHARRARPFTRFICNYFQMSGQVLIARRNHRHAREAAQKRASFFNKGTSLRREWGACDSLAGTGTHSHILPRH